MLKKAGDYYNFGAVPDDAWRQLITACRRQEKATGSLLNIQKKNGGGGSNGCYIYGGLQEAASFERQVQACNCRWRIRTSDRLQEDSTGAAGVARKRDSAEMRSITDWKLGGTGFERR
jgi:hypothetical protein